MAGGEPLELSKLIQEFLLSQFAEQKSTHTVDWYGEHLKMFYRWLTGQQEHRDPLAVQTIVAFYNHRRVAGVAATTLHGDLSG